MIPTFVQDDLLSRQCHLILEEWWNHALEEILVTLPSDSKTVDLETCSSNGSGYCAKRGRTAGRGRGGFGGLQPFRSRLAEENCRQQPKGRDNKKKRLIR